MYLFLGSIIIGIICVPICVKYGGKPYDPGSPGRKATGGPLTYLFMGHEITDLLGNYKSSVPARKPSEEVPMNKPVFYTTFTILLISFGVFTTKLWICSGVCVVILWICLSLFMFCFIHEVFIS